MDTVEVFSGKNFLEVGGTGCAKKTNNKKNSNYNKLFHGYVLPLS